MQAISSTDPPAGGDERDIPSPNTGQTATAAPASTKADQIVPGDGTSQLNAALGQLGRVLRSFIIDRADNVSGLQLAILGKLRYDSSARLTEIAAAIGCDLSVASRQAMLLVERGLAAKTRDPDDGRALRFTLTEQGTRAIDASTQARLQWLDEQLSGFNDAQRADAAAILVALVPALRCLRTRRADPLVAQMSAHTVPPTSNQTEDHS